MSKRPKKPIDIDGTMLEGGGQVLRLSLALSSLTDVPIRIRNIRGKRGAHGKDGGMKQAHLGGAAWLMHACEADTEGMVLRSRELLFQPGLAAKSSLKEVHKIVTRDGVTVGRAPRGHNTVSKDLPQIWHDAIENGSLVCRETHIALTIPGSVFGVLQAILPFALFRSAPASSNPPVPLKITIDGGTNVWHSMSYEWAEHVLFPMLHSRLGIGPIEMKLHQRSWSTGPRSIGSVTFTIPPLDPTTSIPTFSFTSRGDMSKISIFIFASDRLWQTALLDTTQFLLSKHYPEIPQEVSKVEFSGHPARLYLLLVAHTSNGYRLGRDTLFAGKIVQQKMEKTVGEVAGQVVDALRSELDHGGCVDEYLQDQLIVFQTLASGRSTVERTAAPSLHTLTARWVAETVCNVEFDETGSCQGIGYCTNT